MIRHARVTTVNGSVYEFKVDSFERWWLKGKNVPNPTSPPIDPDTWWWINMPSYWPPVHGQMMLATVKTGLRTDDPGYFPGGGIMTSVVADIQILETDAT